MWDFDQGKYIDSRGVASFEESGVLNEALSDMQDRIKTLEDFAKDAPYRFLRKDIEDTSEKLTTFDKGLYTNLLRSKNFSSGLAGSGFRLLHDETGSHLEVDYATFRKKAYFFELVIQQISHQGGILFFTPARMECSEVQITADGFKCFFDTKSGTVSNDFAVGDQARCQRFDLGVTTAKYYWRLVTEVGPDYIVLSLADADEGSDQPQAGDMIVQLGNRTDPTRQAAKVTTVVGHEAPRDEYYEGINSYDLTGRLITVVGVRDGKVGIFTDHGVFSGSVTIGANSAGLENLSEWADKQSQINEAHTTASEAALLAESSADAIEQLQEALANLDNDSVLEVSEKFSLRTEWEKINGLASLVDCGSSGSYMTALRTLETLGYSQGDNVIVTYGDFVLTFNGVKIVYNQTGLDALKNAYEALKEYFVSVRLYENAPTEGFDRQEAARRLTEYYDAQATLLNLAQKYHAMTASSEALDQFVNTTYKDTIEQLKKSIDQKSETFRQDADPSADWKDDQTKQLHEGDIWWNTSDSTVSGVPAGATAIYTKSGDSYIWNLQPVPKEVFDYADGKTTIHLTKPDSYQAKDLWILENDDVMEGFQSGTMLVSSAASDTFDASHWSKKDRYTDDTRADEAAAAADAAAVLAESAASAARQAQAAADKAKSIADAASNTLTDWSADNIISPVEKSGVRDELAFITADKGDIANQTSRFAIASTNTASENYESAFKVYKNDLDQILTAADPVSVPTDMSAHQTDFYTARTAILDVIAKAAKTVADKAQEAADEAQDAADEAQKRADDAYSFAEGLKELLDQINDDTTLDLTEKRSIRTQWEMIAGAPSLATVGKDGSYQTALDLADALGVQLGIPMVITFNGAKIVYNGSVIAYNVSGLDQMKAAFEELRIYLSSVRLYENAPTEGFDREQFAKLITAYYSAEKFFLASAQAAYANERVEEESSALAENLSTSVGYESFSEMEAAASAGKTITVGGYINTDLIKAKAILAEHLAAGAVTADKIAAGAITAEKIDSQAITADKIKAKTLTADQIDLINLFAQFIQATNMEILQGCKIANIVITESGLRIDTDANGSIYIDEERGFRAENQTQFSTDAGTQYTIATMGGCAGTAMSALAGSSPPLHCVNYNDRAIALEVQADDEGAAIFSQLGMFVGFRPLLRNLGAPTYTESLTELDNTIIITKGSLNLPYKNEIGRPHVPMGHPIRIIHTSTQELTINSTIGIATLGSTTLTFTITSTKAEPIELVYNGSCWFRIQ